MKRFIILAVLLCIVALVVAKKGPKGMRNVAAKHGKVACFKSFLNCTKAATTKEAKKECREKLHLCKERVKELLTKITQIKQKPTGNQKPSHKGRGRHRGQKHHFCGCFKRFVGCIRKHHNKTKSAADGQKITIHEEVFSHAESSLSARMEKSDLADMDYKMRCARLFKCCWGKEKCGDKKEQGGKPKRKGRGKKSKRVSRGKSKGKHGKRPKPFPRPPAAFTECITTAKKCKDQAGGSKKKEKACAKNFVKCVLSKCSKKG